MKTFEKTMGLSNARSTLSLASCDYMIEKSEANKAKVKDAISALLPFVDGRTRAAKRLISTACRMIGEDIPAGLWD